MALLSKNAGSILCLYRALLEHRRASPVLTHGSYRRLSTDADVLLFLRMHETGSRLVALNFDDQPALAGLPPGMSGRIALSTHLDRSDEPVSSELPIRPDEGLLIELDNLAPTDFRRTESGIL